MKRTLEERLVAGLIAEGWREDRDERSNLRGFRHAGLADCKRFVGKAGALRQGPCRSKSFSIGDPTRQTLIYKRILAAGDSTLDSTLPPAAKGVNTESYLSCLEDPQPEANKVNPDASTQYEV